LRINAEILNIDMRFKIHLWKKYILILYCVWKYHLDAPVFYIILVSLDNKDKTIHGDIRKCFERSLDKICQKNVSRNPKECEVLLRYITTILTFSVLGSSKQQFPYDVVKTPLNEVRYWMDGWSLRKIRKLILKERAFFLIIIL